MSYRFSLEGKTFMSLRRLCAYGNLLAWLIVLAASFDPGYRWLQKSGYIAAFLFSAGNLVFFYWHEKPPARSGDDERGGAQQ
jgi:hypothetical protein